MSQLNCIWEGAANAPQPPASPAVGLDYADSVFYVSSKPTPTAPSVWVPVGGGAIVVPVVTASVQVVNATVPESLSITAPAGVGTLYCISIYLKALGTGSAGHTYTKTVTYQAADGSGQQTITLILPLNTSNVVMETYPLFILGGSTLTADGVYGGGATNDPYTLSMRIVSMPLAGGQ